MLEQIAPSARPTVGALAQARQWWREEKTDAWRHMLQRAKKIADEQTSRRDDLRLFASLYSGRRLSSLYHFDADKSPSDSWDYVGHRVTWNLCQAAVDTACARISQSRTRARISTFGGDWKQHQRAELLTKWTDGLFHEQNYYDDTADPCFNDACWADGGLAKITGDKDGVQIERILPFEFLVDDAEGMSAQGRSGRPRVAYQVGIFPRDAVMDSFGTSDELRDIINTAPKASQAEHRGDVIEVVEAWYSTRDKKGRRLISCGGGQLVDEDWKMDRVPVVRLVYGRLPAGYWGQGIVSRLVGLQREINRILSKVQEAMRKMAGGHWAVPIGSHVSENDLMNLQGSLVYYAGGIKPEPLIVPAMPPEVYLHLERLWKSGFDIIGLSDQSVTGTIPGGMSGRAQREAQDTQQLRFSQPARRKDAFTIDVADLTIATARRVFSGNKDARVRAPGTRIIEEIAWKDVDMKEDSYVVRAFPSNFLPLTPAAKYEALNEMVDKGTISPEAAAAQVDNPDVEAAVAPGAAQYEEAVRAVSALLDGDTYECPDETLRPDMALTIGTAMYQRARRDGCPAKNLGLVLRWLDDARQSLLAAAPPLGAGMPAAPVPAPAPPGMPQDAGLEGMAPPMGAPPPM